MGDAGAAIMRPNHDPSLGPPRLAHLKAHQYVECGHLTRREFNDYFKFTFVRNPWDRMVSLYKYIGLRKGFSFKEFLMEKFIDDLWINWRWFVGPQSDFVCDSYGKLMVDFLGRFETLQDDFQTVCRRLSLPVEELPHVNKSKGPRFGVREMWRRFRVACGVERVYRKYQDYYDKESKNVVAELYARDIERFGYSFQPNQAEVGL